MKVKLKILHLEDVPDEARLVSQVLKKSMIDAEIAVVDNEKDFEKALHEFSPDVVLSDHSLPSFNSVEALKIFKQSNLQIPFILVTAAVSEDFAVSAIKSGVDDYILKDNLTRLPFAIDHALKQFKTEREMQTILNRITDSVVSLDKEWRYTFINDAALATHPLGREATIGKVIWDVHPQTKGTIFWDKYHEAMETQKVTEVETYYAPLDIWFYLKAHPSPEGLTLVYQDITERKNAYAIIAQNEKRFRALIENSTDGLTVINADGIVVEMSPSGRKILGYEEMDIIGKNRPDLIHADDRDKVMNAFKEIIVDPTNIKILEYRHKMPDGSDKWLECTFHNLLQEPNINAIVLNYREITERKKNEDQQRLFASIVNSSDDAIISKTLAGTITSWNQGAEKVFGYTQAEIVGKPITVLIPAHLQSEEVEIIGKIGRGENIKHFETVRVTKTGQMRHVSLTISPIKDSSGVIVGASKILRDITDRKRTEDELKKNTLELERSNKELEQFAFIASHDLQEPLRMVGSYMQLIERKYKGKLDSDADEFIHYAIDGASRMKQLVNDLLNYSRLNKETDRSLVDLNKVINIVRQNLSESIKEAKAVLTVSGLPVIEGYETQMIQLFQNLISNAIKFRQKEIDPVIQVQVEKKNDQWLFSVSDNGIGIDQAYADKIFIIFRKLHTREKYGGTGIGLAVAKKIVERHGGKIWFESAIGKGTTFFFTLNPK